MKAAVAGVILAGGRGQRLDGQDKGLVPFRARPLIAHGLDRFAPQVDRLMLSVNRHAGAYVGFGYPLVWDEPCTFAGPLAGIAAALAASRAPWLATIPCDTPFIPTDLVARLLDACHRTGARAAVAAGDDGRLHYGCLVVHRDRHPSIQEALTTGPRALRDRVHAWDAQVVGFANPPGAFRNLNTWADLEAAERGL